MVAYPARYLEWQGTLVPRSSLRTVWVREHSAVPGTGQRTNSQPVVELPSLGLDWTIFITGLPVTSDLSSHTLSIQPMGGQCQSRLGLPPKRESESATTFWAGHKEPQNRIA